MKKLSLASVVAAIALAGAGCGFGGEVTVPRDQDVDGELRELRASAGPPLYFVGTRFEGLPLTDVEFDPANPGEALFAYGTCTIPLPADGGCAVPIQIQIFPFDAGRWRDAYGCRRQPSLRGVTVVRHDGLVLVTGRSVVKIYARDASEDRRVAVALRDARARAKAIEELPRAPRNVDRLLAAACTPP